jgi:protein PhnA
MAKKEMAETAALATIRRRPKGACFEKDVMEETKDSNGAVLNDGDSVQLIKDLKVKGSSLNLKRGKVIKNIRLTSDNEEVECREGKSTLVLKSCFLKKV